MINSIYLQPLRNGEFIQFLADFLDIVLKQNPDNLQVRALYDALQQIAGDNEKLFKISQGSIITKEIEAADLRRDSAVTGMGLVAGGFTYHTDAALQRHARAVTAHLNLFGNIAKDNYLSETAIIRNILADWDEKPELTAAITALGLDAWKAELAAANADFTAVYTSRNEELAGASAHNLKAKRVEANTAYYKLRDRLNSHFDIHEGAEPWATTINLVNQTIDNYNTLLSRRGPNPAEVVIPAPAEVVTPPPAP